MIKIHDVEQKSDAWFKLRTDYPFTASHATAIRVAGAGLKTLIRDKLSEKFSLGITERYTNEAMENGNELEAEARSILELKRNVKILEHGFITNDKYEFAGASPDGVCDKFLTEIKCPTDKVYIDYLLDEKKLEKKYNDQCQFQMMIIEKDKNLLTAYNPNYKKDTIEILIDKDDKIIEEIKIGLEKAKKMWIEAVAELEIKLKK